VRIIVMMILLLLLLLLLRRRVVGWVGLLLDCFVRVRVRVFSGFIWKEEEEDDDADDDASRFSRPLDNLSPSFSNNKKYILLSRRG